MDSTTAPLTTDAELEELFQGLTIQRDNETPTTRHSRFGQRTTMDDLRILKSSYFPVSFSHPDLIQVTSHSQFQDYAKLLTLKLHPDEVKTPATSTFSLNPDPNTSSTPANNETAARPSGQSEKNDVVFPKGWLTSWLIYVDLFCCHITHAKPICPGMVDFAHILLPQAERNNTNLKTFFEFILGMQPSSLVIHSRLFLLPLRTDIHRCLDHHAFVMLPSLELLQIMEMYFSRLEDRYLSWTGNRNHNDKIAPADFWTSLRSGKLDEDFEELVDGNLNKFHIIADPALSEGKKKYLKDGETFFSHISPFAALFNLLHTAYIWHRAKPELTLNKAILEHPGLPDKTELLARLVALKSKIQILQTRFQQRNPTKESKGKGNDRGSGDGASRTESRQTRNSQQTDHSKGGEGGGKSSSQEEHTAWGFGDMNFISES